MSDLREALDTAQWPANRDAQWHRAQDVILAAARRFLALTETGTREWRCKVQPFWTPDDTKEDYDAYMERLMDPWDETGDAGHYCAPFRPHREGCGWVLVIPADYLTEEE